ncbi:hypothetical protein SELMODRAFT_407245 [Selaginella moellendorffii]|uniref:Pollen Ole e 1 allergen and extensin family protein n=1 Tax=Selaginella moellendorffii TaxID=88036 RepID=D8R4E3_SELML|nr:hypothetical protein SELMODRAFT_407245 [Selaginella moellendorffii]
MVSHASYVFSSYYSKMKRLQLTQTDPKNENDPPPVSVVEGIVYCQDCQGHWTKKISDALVSVVCKDKAGLITAYAMDNSDDSGYFQIKVPNYDCLHQENTTCVAQLVTTSDETCNKMTNEGDGAQGAKLRPFTSYYNEMFFRVGPFAFTPYTCNE